MGKFGFWKSKEIAFLFLGRTFIGRRRFVMGKRSFLIAFSVFAIVGILWAAFPRESQAIPPFARKYKTACTTCHWSSFPKLNAFGRAFRANGLRMPGGDEVFVKDEPVSQGSDAWSRLFPKSVWPSDIPGMPPIGMAFSSEFNMTRERNANPLGAGGGRRDSKPGNYFDGIGGIELFSGGTMGETFSWFSVVGIYETDDGFTASRVEVDRVYFNYSPFVFGEQGLANVRFGQFEPRVVPMSNHRRQLRATPYLMDIFPVLPVGNFFGFAPNQKGFEIWGNLNGPGGKGGLEWAVGVVNGQPGGAIHVFEGASGISGTIAENVEGRNGRFDVNSGKDWYVTASYKIGGMGVLGEESVDDSLVAKENWQDDSVTIKGYFYQGSTGAWVDDPGGAIGNAAFMGPATDDNWDEDANSFKRFGVVVDANWWNFNIIGAASFMEDDLNGTTTMPSMANLPQETGDKFYVDIYTAEVQYVAYPWLIPSFRFEKVNPDYDVRDLSTFERYSFDVAILARANMKFLAGASFSSLPDSKTGVNGLEVSNPDLPPLDDLFRIGVDICF
jgi:hypothetical protein